MGKFWSLVFLSVPVLGVAVFVAAASWGYWFPQNVSAHGGQIDHLFMVILWLTGAVFLATEIVLAVSLWRFDGAKSPRARFSRGNMRIELGLAAVVGLLLVFITVYQLEDWAEAKIRQPDLPPTVEVNGRQFEWVMRYPGPNGELGDADDLFSPGDLHVPVDEDILVSLVSEDVLHSFYLPNLRIKQDAVPGMRIPVWFRATETGVFDLVCAELCGWGHYKMAGRLIVESRADYEAFLTRLEAEQNEDGFEEQQPTAANTSQRHPSVAEVVYRRAAR